MYSDYIHILYVDDGRDAADIPTAVLEAEDDRFTIRTATSASDGLDQLTDEIDCIVSGYDLPGQTGLEFLATVREGYPDLPFILFTDKGTEAVASEAISAGVTEYLQKGGADQYTILANYIRNAVELNRAHRERQRHLDAIETAQEGISILNEDGTFVYVNEAYATLFGYESEELIGKHWELLYHDEDVPRVREEILPTVERMGRWNGKTTGRRADGSTFPADHTLATTDDGKLICTVRDITDQADLQQKYELVARASMDAFWDWCPETGETERNDEYLASFGYEQSDIDDTTDWWRERIHPDDRDRVLAAFENAVENPAVSYDESYRFRKKDGTYGYLRSRGYVDYDENGEPTRMVGAHIDITEARERERKLRRQNEQLEEFAGILSHDLRNPLNVARGRIEVLEDEYDSEHFDVIMRAHDRMETLIDDILTLARNGETAPDVQPLLLPEVITQCWQNVETRDATLVTESEQRIRADSSRLQQLLENLIRNAVEHGGQAVTVTVGDLDDGFFVADDGVGIPEYEREHMFEIGPSTSDEGTGIGLGIVQQVADAHDWSITVTESSDCGARFEIRDVEILS